MTEKLCNIEHPHEHDVLSGRGNFVNYHVGNEYFRTLVRKHKLDYVRCPKPQKGKFSRMIVDEIKARDPPGRFLKQDESTKLWYDIGDKKALDKTRQALREGAPEIVKEISGESDDESDGESNQPHVVQTDGYVRSSGFGSEASASNFIQSFPMQSPVGMPSPMTMNSLSPELMPFSGGAAIGGGMLHMMDPAGMPCPPLHTSIHADALSQIKAQQQVAMMMNMQMNNNFRFNVAVPGMISQEQLQVQNQIQQQQMQLNLLQQQLRQQEAQMKNNQTDLASNDIQLMNMTRMNMNHAIMPNQAMSTDNLFQNLSINQFGQQPINEMLPPLTAQSETIRQGNNLHKSAPMEQGIDTMPGNNPRRMPPSSLLKREDSIKMEKVFSKSPLPQQKGKVDNGSSNQLSAMSISIADMQEGNLSSVFDSSLRISNDKSPTKSPSKRRIKLKHHNLDASSMEMSMNTIGTNAGGDMSYSMLSSNIPGHDLNDSDGDMSFGKVFDDQKD